MSGLGIFVGIVLFLAFLSVLCPSLVFGRCSTLPYDEWVTDPECQSRRRR
jgi:hypothetical protein